MSVMQEGEDGRRVGCTKAIHAPYVRRWTRGLDMGASFSPTLSRVKGQRHDLSSYVHFILSFRFHITARHLWPLFVPLLRLSATKQIGVSGAQTTIVKHSAISEREAAFFLPSSALLTTNNTYELAPPG